MKHNYLGEFDNVCLKPLSIEDIEMLRIWRNNKEQTGFLRQIGEITPEMQLNWYNSYLENQHDIVFGIHETKEGGNQNV